MNDAIQILEKDHREVEKLFEQLKTTQDPTKSKALFLKLFEELSVHAIVEEQVVYPELARFKVLASKAKEAYREHADVKAMLGDIAVLEPGSKDWTKKINQLEKDVQHHVKEEEGEIFKAMRETMPQQEIKDMTSKIQECKRTAPQTPLMQFPIQHVQESMGSGVQE